MPDVTLSQPAASPAIPDSPPVEAASEATLPQATLQSDQPQKTARPLGVEVGIRQVVADGKLVAMPDRDQIKAPWMDQ